MKNTLLLLVLSFFIPCSAQENITPVATNRQPNIIAINQKIQSLPVVEFVGNKAFSSEILKKGVDECLVRDARYIKENNSDVLTRCVMETRKLMWQRGYIQGKFSEPQLQQTAAGMKAIVTVDEGIAYRLGDITFDGLKVFPAEKITNLLKIKKGEIGDFNQLHEWIEAIEEIYKERGYHLIDADPQPEFLSPLPNQTEGTVNLKVFIDEGKQFRINYINFSGNKMVWDRTMRDALVTDAGDIFEDKLLKKSIENLNKLNLFEPIDADRDVELRTDEKSTGIYILIKVKEKSTTKVNSQENWSKPEVEFVGNKAVSSEILKNKADVCLVKYAEYVKDNSSSVLAQCLRESQKVLWQKGYLQAKFSEPQIQKTANAIKAIVTVDEGIAYRLGEVTFESLKVLSVEEVNKLTKLKKGELVDGLLIQDWIESIKDAYKERGYALIMAATAPEFLPPQQNQTEGIINLKIEIDEESQYRINKINFSGNGNVRDQQLRNAMTIEEGQIFNSKLLKTSIDQLNQLNLFEPIDYDKNVIIMTDDETPRVDILIKVKEKIKP